LTNNLTLSIDPHKRYLTHSTIFLIVTELDRSNHEGLPSAIILNPLSRGELSGEAKGKRQKARGKGE
ncbi:MAG: hypothetical protein PX634_36805, partial [Microcystis sp. M53600_WE12]|nr:hypothetical protein [Microcystis sp. M53600_WE12]